MKTLYKHILDLKLNGNVKKLFSELKIKEGYELLQQVSSNSDEQILIAKYTADAYSNESPLHGIHKTRTALKSAVLSDLGVSGKQLFIEISNNENEKYDDFVKWMWLQESDYYFQAIITTQEVIETQLNVARMKINKGGELVVSKDGATTEPQKMDEDKYLKAINIQNVCLTNAVSNIQKLEELKDTRLKKYERSDDAVEREVYKNSGSAERGAMLAEEIRKQMNSQ